MVEQLVAGKVAAVASGQPLCGSLMSPPIPVGHGLNKLATLSWSGGKVRAAMNGTTQSGVNFLRSLLISIQYPWLGNQLIHRNA